MALMRHGRQREEIEPFGWAWEDWADMFRRPWAGWRVGEHLMRVDEFVEDGTLVVRAELPGIDPDKDVEITLSDHTLTIEAERREEETKEGRHFVRSELRYGSFYRSFVVPEAVTEADVKASYRDGILEVRVPRAEPKPATKVPVVKVERAA